MKKRILFAVAVLTASISFAQKKIQPPPLPPSPPPVVDVKDVQPPPPPPAAKMDLSRDDRAFLKRNPTIKGIAWSDDKVRIRLKSGKEEVYDRKNKEEMKQLKNKYGELPVPPPPPVPPKTPRNISEA